MHEPRGARFSAVRVTAGIAAIVTVVLAARAMADPAAVARFLAPDDHLEHADAILVFSGDPYYERTLEAARLYRLGYASYLVLSGRGGPGDSGRSMAAVARLHGVPDQAMLLEEQAASTYENVLFVRELLARHRVRTLILVTSPYHQRRAYLVARHVLRGVVLINHAVPQSYWSPQEWWRDPAARATLVHEYAKLAGYFILRRI